MFKLSKESKVTFLCLLVIPIVWIIVNHLGLIDGWKTKSVDLRLNSKIPGARGQILHDNESLEFVKIEENKTIPKIPKIVYVNFDAATLAMDDVGERPWDRAFLGICPWPSWKKEMQECYLSTLALRPKVYRRWYLKKIHLGVILLWES